MADSDDGQGRPDGEHNRRDDTLVDPNGEIVTDAELMADAELIADAELADGNPVSEVIASSGAESSGLSLVNGRDGSQSANGDDESLSAVFRFVKPAASRTERGLSSDFARDAAPKGPVSGFSGNGSARTAAPNEVQAPHPAPSTQRGHAPPNAPEVPTQPPLSAGVSSGSGSLKAQPTAPSYVPLTMTARISGRAAGQKSPEAPPRSNRTLEGLVPEAIRQLHLTPPTPLGRPTAQHSVSDDDDDDDDDITLVFGRRWLDQARTSTSPNPGPAPSQAPPPKTAVAPYNPRPQTAAPTALGPQNARVLAPFAPGPATLTPASVPTTPVARGNASVAATRLPPRASANAPYTFSQHAQSGPPASFTVPPDFRPQSRFFRPLAAVFAVVAVVAIALWLLPQSGRLNVDFSLAGTSELPVNPRVYLDGKLACSRANCILENLEEKSYLVVAEADGYQRSREIAVSVSAYDPAQLSFTLKPHLAKLSLSSNDGTISATLNGQPKGKLPLTLEDLPEGSYELLLDGGSAFRPVTRTIELKAGEAFELNNIALEVKTGTATLTAGENARGAVVKVGAKRVRLPHTLDIDLDDPPTISARKRGFEFSGLDFEFERGKRVRSFAVNLTKTTVTRRTRYRKVRPNTKKRTSDSQGGADAQKQVTSDKYETSAGKAVSGSEASLTPTADNKVTHGTLNLVSYPPSKVILDGRPLGLTPRRGVTVTPGAHNVVFVHSDMGRRRAATTVRSGATRTVTARFK